MKKRSLSFMMAALMVGSMATGCGSASNQAATTAAAEDRHRAGTCTGTSVRRLR